MLTPREAIILEMRFGLDGKFYTQAEIAAKLALSKSRIGQIEEKALRKIVIPFLLEEQEKYRIAIMAKKLGVANGSEKEKRAE